MNFETFKLFLKRVQLFSLLMIFVIGVTIAFFPKIKERITLLNKQKQIQEKITAVEMDIENIRKKEIALKNNPLYAKLRDERDIQYKIICWGAMV